MDYQNYEDYMRQVLGYTPRNPNIYETYDYRAPYENTYNRNDINIQLTEDEINELYPEIYRLVYPMVCKVCSSNTQPITKELIEKMTEEVYTAIEDTETIVNVKRETKKSDNTTSQINHTQSNRRSEIRTERTAKKEEPKEVRKSENEFRQTGRNQSLLRDLIKILILNRLLGGNRPPRPRPPRTPFPREAEMSSIPLTNQQFPSTRTPNYTDYLKFQ